MERARIAAIDIQANGAEVLFLEGGTDLHSFRQVSAAYLSADDLDQFGGADAAAVTGDSTP